jgi:hypothetical protein
MDFYFHIIIRQVIRRYGVKGRGVTSHGVRCGKIMPAANMTLSKNYNLASGV